MYPEHFELLPWVLSNVPVALESRHVPACLARAYAVFYEYLHTILIYHTDQTI